MEDLKHQAEQIADASLKQAMASQRSAVSDADPVPAAVLTAAYMQTAASAFAVLMAERRHERLVKCLNGISEVIARHCT